MKTLENKKNRITTALIIWILFFSGICGLFYWGVLQKINTPFWRSGLFYSVIFFTSVAAILIYVFRQKKANKKIKDFFRKTRTKKIQKNKT